MTAQPLTVDIDLREVDSFLLHFPQSGPEIVRANLRVAMDDALSFTENQVVDNTPVNTSALRGSIYSEIRGIQASPLGGAEATGAVSSSDYELKVWAMESGRAPGKMPPIEAIALWVRRKGLAGTYSVETKKRIGSKSKKAREDLSLAWAIAIRIAKGTSRHQLMGGYKMFEKGYNASNEHIVKAFDDAIDNILHHWSSVK